MTQTSDPQSSTWNTSATKPKHLMAMINFCHKTQTLWMAMINEKQGVQHPQIYTCRNYIPSILNIRDLCAELEIKLN